MFKFLSIIKLTLIDSNFYRLTFVVLCSNISPVSHTRLMWHIPGADPGFLKGGGVQNRSTSKKRGGGRRGSNFGPNVKKPTSWHKRGGGGPDPLDPPPSGSATACGIYMMCMPIPYQLSLLVYALGHCLPVLFSTWCMNHAIHAMPASGNHIHNVMHI